MKTLEQLGISPAPWRQEANGYGTLDVLGNDDSLVVAYENPINKHDQENRRLIAAAPELYKALRGLLEIVCVDCKSSYEIDGKCVKCPRVVAAEAALSAPPRNCDRPECATTKSAQDVWRKEDGGKTAYYEWLLATSMKGEKK